MENNKSQSRFQEPEKRRGRVADAWAETLWDKLADRLARIRAKDDIKSILENLISEDEKKTALRRLAILALIREGKSYREIGKILWVSPQTISTVRKNVIGKYKHYKSYLAFYGGPIQYSAGRITRKKSFWKEFEEMLQDVDLWEIIKNPPRPPGMGIKQK